MIKIIFVVGGLKSSAGVQPNEKCDIKSIIRHFNLFPKEKLQYLPALVFPLGGVTCIGSKIGHQVALLANMLSLANTC